jgi:hypothetical protein
VKLLVVMVILGAPTTSYKEKALLAKEAEKIEKMSDFSTEESRGSIKAEIEKHYTGPA